MNGLIPANELQCLSVLNSYRVLETAPKLIFDRFHQGIPTKLIEIGHLMSVLDETLQFGGNLGSERP